MSQLFICIPDTATVRDPNPDCPRNELHTHSPEGYIAWHDWAASMNYKGHRQSRCPGCNLYVIWGR